MFSSLKDLSSSAYKNDFTTLWSCASDFLNILFITANAFNIVWIQTVDKVKLKLSYSYYYSIAITLEAYPPNPLRNP